MSRAAAPASFDPTLGLEDARTVRMPLVLPSALQAPCRAAGVVALCFALPVLDACHSDVQPTGPVRSVTLREQSATVGGVADMRPEAVPAGSTRGHLRLCTRLTMCALERPAASTLSGGPA